MILTVQLESTCRIVTVSIATQLAQHVLQEERAAVHHALQEDGVITQPTVHLHALIVTVVVEFRAQALNAMVSQHLIVLYVDKPRFQSIST